MSYTEFPRPDTPCSRCGTTWSDFPGGWYSVGDKTAGVWTHYCATCFDIMRGKTPAPQHDTTPTPAPQHRRKRFFKWR